MTPESKAKELVERFKDAAKNQIFKNWDYYHKQCALIAVDEIIEENKNLAQNYVDDFRLLYWQQVKQAIEKL